MIERFDDHMIFVIEATIRSMFIYRIPTVKGFEVKIADPKALVAITRSKNKTELKANRCAFSLLQGGELAP